MSCSNCFFDVGWSEEMISRAGVIVLAAVATNVFGEVDERSGSGMIVLNFGSLDGALLGRGGGGALTGTCRRSIWLNYKH